MSSWLIKSAVQRAISLLPNSQKWNEWLQERVTKSLTLTLDGLEAKLEICRKFLDDFAALRPHCAENFTALELGTGWHPIVPIGLYLCGAGEIWSYDINALLRPERLRTLLELFAESNRRGNLQKLLPQLCPDRLQNFLESIPLAEQESPEQFLRRLNIHIKVQDAQSTGLPADSIDLFFSYSVLEYIPPSILKNLFAEFKRAARPGAVMIHHIAMFDQFARFDSSITQLNYLRFTSAQWKWLRSPLIPLTRLRIPEYRAATQQSSFKIVKESTTSVAVETLDKLKVAPEFQKYSREDLCVVTAWQVSQSE